MERLFDSRTLTVAFPFKFIEHFIIIMMSSNVVQFSNMVQRFPVDSFVMT